MPVNIRNIQEQLNSAGYRYYSELLEPYAEKISSIHRIGVIGDQFPELKIEANIPYMSENNIEFIEFPEVFSKRFHELIE